MSIQRTLSQVPKEGFLRTGELLALIPVSRVTLWRWTRDKKIAAPHKIGGTTLWPASAVRAIIDAASLPDH